MVRLYEVTRECVVEGKYRENFMHVEREFTEKRLIERFDTLQQAYDYLSERIYYGTFSRDDEFEVISDIIE